MASVLEALHFNFSTFILQAINLLIVMGVLYILLYKPLMRVIEERDNKIENNLQEAQSAKEEANELLAQYKEQLGQAREEARGIIENAKKIGDDTRERIIAEAREEANKTLEKAKREIETEKAKALGEIRSEAATLAVLVAGKVIKKELDTEEHKRLAQEFVDEVGEVQ
ncbi:MAG: F-type H+-transporting ATPase subunit b [Clostridia bacterium]|jgi:F-type H+-transporting ATPase subunit b|nr:synthase subunit [Clostridiales bacterium]MDK2985067.1 F-type H+-transporting ATPase subunit b [Clostridia bacterium]